MRSGGARGRIAAAWLLGASCAGGGEPGAVGRGDELLIAGKSIELPGVKGRIDHLAYDAVGKRLFVAALGNGSVEVVDLDQAAVMNRIGKLEEPQGILFLPATKQLVFTTGGDGKLHVHDAATLAPVKTIDVGGDADNVRFDPGSGLLYVGVERGLAVVDAAKWERVATIALEGHAESFQLDPPQGCERIYVNVPSAGHVAVVDAKARKATATWPTGGDAREAYPMALDAKGGRLYLGCRAPACLLVLDAKDPAGKRLAKLPLGGDCDDLFLDAERGLLYASCGQGVVSVVKTSPNDLPVRATDVASADGARTSLFLADRGMLVVAAPQRGSKPAALDFFAVR
jgi:DNA-binding beta-propeller fold protein YncE